ncbi:MAG TPA: amino acid adenylation domain-containing protein [Candidatus Angelobacter sp.]
MKKDLLEEERELLQRLLEKEGLGVSSSQSAPVAAHEQQPLSAREGSGIRPSLFPLSYPQEQLWFLDRFQPGNAFYNVLVAWRIEGDLDVARLERSLQEVIGRHEILRTCFVTAEDKQPRQKVIAKRLDVRLPLVDLKEVEASEREKQARKVLTEDGDKAFDLGRLPLLRGVLVRMGKSDHILGLTLHHIICDDWSFGVLMEELGRLYEAYGKGQESPLPKLGMQYGDYATEQREVLRGEKYRQQMEYWKRRLEGMPQVLELFTDLGRPARQSFRGGTEDLKLGTDLWDRLNAVANREKASAFLTLLAACQVLLMRYTGQEDFGVGTPVANRKRRETERLIGFFLNTLVIRADLRGEPTFLKVLRQAREAALEGYEHEDLPFEKLVEELAPHRDVSRTPMFQVMATFLGQSSRLQFGGLELSDFEVDLSTSKFDLFLNVKEDRQGATVALNYSTDLFEAQTIRRMLGHYKQLLKAVVDHAEQPVWELPLLNEQERQQLEKWNQTGREYSRNKTVAELFEEQAARTPNDTAVEYEERRLTYEELNRQANRLAHYLRSLGVKPDTRVCICVERSGEMVVGLLGVIKAGGAYVPLDPAYPAERLRFMLEDSRPAVLLTQGHLRGLFTEIPEELRVVDLGKADAWSAQPDSNLDHSANGRNANQLVYVIYTSGSTGLPKGVAMPMRAVLNMLGWQMNQAVAARQRTLQFAALGFDVSFQEVFSTLCLGGVLILMDEGKRRNATELVSYLVEKRIERLFVPYVALQMLAEGVGLMAAHLEDGAPFDCALQEITVAGEPLRLDDKIKGLFKRLKNCRLQNQYGPTETHVASSLDLWAGRDSWPVLPPIGRPIGNTQIHILDKHGNPVPAGVVGELYIGGTSVAREYLNRPQLTAERFLEDRFAKEEGARMYRTGDLGRWRADGAIEYIGRNDFQVKIRGHRVEVGEIEAVLQQERGVRRCAVVVKTRANGSKRLVAYVEGERDGEELRRDLKDKLPAYMVPSVIVKLQELPLSGNGKVDRQGLPDADALDPGSGTDRYQPPRNAVEKQLAEIWAEMLEVTRVGIHDNFFDLGGHSLLATFLATRMQTAFGIEVPVRAIFESPSVAELAAVIEPGLRKSDREGLRERPSLVPLSYQQEQLWFLDRLQPGNPFYNTLVAWRISGDLDIPRLERSLEEIVRRQAILRTCFVTAEDEQPRQKVVEERPKVRLPLVDLKAMAASEKKKRARRILAEEGGKPFDLSALPLLRGVLVQMGETDHILGLMLHHIICDDWSFGVLMEELGQLYEAFGKGQESPLPELRMQYGDYAIAQREGLRAGKFKRQMEYWKEQLQGMPQVLELPADMVRPARQSFRGDTEQLELSDDLFDRLNAVARREQASLFMLLLAASQVLLMRYSGQEDFGVGTVVANRKQRESEGMIGFFLNTLVMRANLRGRLTFREALRRARETALGGYEHQDMPFEKLVEELATDRDVSRSPLFQAVFTLRGSLGKLAFGGLELQDYEAELSTTKFDFILIVDETRHDQAAVINYCTDLFKAETIRRMLGHYRQLLNAVVENADRPVWELPLLDEKERKQLEKWNQTGSDYQRDKTIAELFEEQARRHAEEIAVVFGKEQINYGELNRRSNQLGHYLKEKMGVVPDALVGVSMERSIEAIVGTLGVLKAGAAYVPLDPAYPLDRLRYMLEDAGVGVVLTQERLAGQWAETKARIVCLDRDWKEIGPLSGARVESGAWADNLAYVMYTSGSTGQPKGIGITQGNVVDLVRKSDWVGLRCGQAMAQTTSPSFDAAAFELWNTLLNGACLVCISSEVLLDGRKLKAELRDKGVQAVLLVTALFNEYARRSPEIFDSVQQVMFGGETVNAAAVASFLKHRSDARLINLYGPVECTTFCTSHVVNDACDEKASIPIGGPVANTQVYVLDREMNVAPVGIAGELYVGGEGLARSYWRRPELTAEKFIPNPYSEAGGERLYRTGDQGRWLAEGAIEFLGRVDTQVKIRGFRVELGEIEAAVQQQSGVRGCAVAAKTGADGSKRLVAYVAGERNGEELRRDLKAKLPEYMVPSVIVELPELPLTAGGKVDRRALPEVEASGPGTGAEFSNAPRSAVEQQLAQIWVEVLEVSSAGIHDNFFDLGGHSLLANLTAARIENAFGIDFPVRTVFESPTIAQVAEVIELELRESQANGKVAGDSKTGIRAGEAPIARPSLFPLSYQQEQLWFLDRLQPDSDFYNVPLAWRLKGDLDVSRLEQSLQELVLRHEVLRTCFVMAEDEQPRQKVVERLAVPLPLVDLKEGAASEKEKEARRLLAEEGSKAFDLGQIPLLRGVLVRMGERDHILGLTLHHIICDDWSLRALTEELGKLYQAYGKGQESPLPELGMQYGDYAIQQREGLRGEKYRQQMEYWKGQLEGMRQVLDLPTDRERPARLSSRGGIEQRNLPDDLLVRLNAVMKGERVSLFMMLLAAYQVLLMRYCGQEDFGVGTVVANRRQKETEGMIGFFLNTLVIRADLRGGLTFREVLQRTREAMLGGYEHQDMPFEKLVEEFAPDRDASRTPMFQVVFTLRSAPKDLEFGGLELRPVDVDLGTAKFDLIMVADDTRQGATIGLNYSKDLFEAETVRQMLEHYEHLLEAIVANTDQPIWELSMMGEMEKKVLSSWSYAGPVPAAQKNIMEMFDSQAERRPQEPAAIFAQAQLSCTELNRRANQIGHYLARMGVTPETPVGIFMAYSQEMVAAILGVLKAGGAYVLMDVLNPRDRLRCILESSGVATVLTLEGLRKRFPQTGARVVCLDSEWESIAQQSAANPEIQVHPRSLACVIYTSASPEQAKGLMIEHNGLINLVDECQSSEQASQNGHGPESSLPETWSRLTSSSFLVSSSAFITPVATEQRTLARPRGNANIYVFDPHLQRVPIGVPGELWFSAPGMGRGYAGQPSLTAAKFLPDPFASQAGARMCGSGQRARYKTDGAIELLGRVDDRAEIGGYPVELGEIEAALASHESVRQAVVVVRANGELVAYVAASDGRKLSQNEVRSYLDNKLPPYMTPNAFVTLQEFPRNAGGEVDRAALSALGEERWTKELVLPRTELEQTIAATWQTVLGVDQVGVHDNFFELGGHSLLVIQLHQKLRAILSFDLELLHLFQFPTIHSLVRFLHTGYNFEGKSRDTRERAGRQKSAVQKLRRMHTPWAETHLTE